MTDSPPPKRRGWIDALVATALRWNERLGRPVGDADEPLAPVNRRQPPAPRARVGATPALSDAESK